MEDLWHMGVSGIRWRRLKVMRVEPDMSAGIVKPQKGQVDQ